MTNQVSRRSVAKGAAWSAPAVVMASAAPAMASSALPTVTPQICALAFGAGDADMQVQDIYLGAGVLNGRGEIPANTTFTYVFSASRASLPSLNLPAGGGVTGSVVSTSASFTVTVKYSSAYTSTCDPGATSWPKLAWGSAESKRVTPGSTMSLDKTAVTGTGLNAGASASLAWTLPSRRSDQGVSFASRKPLIYTSKGGGQNCYPGAQWTNVGTQSVVGSGTAGQGDDRTCYGSATGACARSQGYQPGNAKNPLTNPYC